MALSQRQAVSPGFTPGAKLFVLLPANKRWEVEAMTILELVAILTLLATVAYYTFSVTWKIANNNKKK